MRSPLPLLSTTIEAGELVEFVIFCGEQRFDQAIVVSSNCSHFAAKCRRGNKQKFRIVDEGFLWWRIVRRRQVAELDE